MFPQRHPFKNWLVKNGFPIMDCDHPRNIKGSMAPYDHQTDIKIHQGKFSPKDRLKMQRLLRAQSKSRSSLRQGHENHQLILG